MTIRFSTSINVFESTKPLISVSFIYSSFAAFLSSTSTSLIFTLSAGLLMPVIQDIINPFYIKKFVIGADNTIVLMYRKETLCIGRVLFPSLDNA